MDKVSRRWVIVLSAAGGFIIGLVISLAAFKVLPDKMLSLMEIKAATVAQETTQTLAEPPKLAPEVAINDNFGALIDHLKQERGYTLDHYSLTYLVMADQQVIGLLRTINESDAHTDIKQFTTSVIEQRKADVTRLLLIQKLLGHNHH